MPAFFECLEALDFCSLPYFVPEAVKVLGAVESAVLVSHVPRVLPWLAHEHEKVRLAALHLLGQLSDAHLTSASVHSKLCPLLDDTSEDVQLKAKDFFQREPAGAALESELADAVLEATAPTP